MVGRGELTDAAWAELAPLLLPPGGRGNPWADHRRIIDGMLRKLRTGTPWRDLPARYGPWSTCHARLVRWQRDGRWDRLLAHVQTRSDAVGEVDGDVGIDSTVVRAHQHAARARKGGRLGRAGPGRLRGHARPRSARAQPGRADDQAPSRL